MLFGACGVFFDAAALFRIVFFGMAVLDFRDTDSFSPFESMAFNCDVGAFGEYNVLTENLLKLVPSPSGAAFVPLLGFDLVVNDDDVGVVLIDGEIVGDSFGIDGTVGADEFLGPNEFEPVDV